MILPVLADTQPPHVLRHFEDDEGLSYFGEAALSCVAAGWTVVALSPRSKRPMRRGRGTLAPGTVRETWRREPSANVGINLDGTGVVVLDEDGETGRASLDALVERTGVPLPETFVVTTGRQDGGRHLWYRLPPGCEALTNQGSGRDGPHPGLDVKFRWLVVAPGSRHRTGAFYTANWSRMARREELAELPRPLYDALAAVGHPQQPTRTRCRGRREIEVTRAPDRRRQGPPPVQGRRLRTLLDDTSDGREHRTVRVVRDLVRLGYSDDDIKATVLAAPLGGKALSQPDPEAFLQRKIDWARDRGPTNGPAGGWDRETYFAAVHRANLGASDTRVLDYLLVRAGRAGRVAESQDRIGIGAATDSADDTLRRLVAAGWLAILDDPSPMLGLPRTYGLTVPPKFERQNQDPTAGTPTPPTISTRTRRSWVLDLSRLARDDAFRYGALNSAYPALFWLAERPQRAADIARSMRADARAVQRALKALADAQIAVKCVSGYRLTSEPLSVLLRAVAAQAGTAGARANALARYRAKCASAREKRTEYKRAIRTPGSVLWMAKRREEYVVLVKHDAAHALVEEWLAADRSLDELVDYLVARERDHLTRWIDLADVTDSATTDGHGPSEGN